VVVLHPFLYLSTKHLNNVYEYITSPLFPEPWAVRLVHLETGSTRTQTIPDASEKDVTSRNQTHAPKKRRGPMPCAYSFKRLINDR